MATGSGAGAAVTAPAPGGPGRPWRRRAARRARPGGAARRTRKRRAGAPVRRSRSGRAPPRGAGPGRETRRHRGEGRDGGRAGDQQGPSFATRSRCRVRRAASWDQVTRAGRGRVSMQPPNSVRQRAGGGCSGVPLASARDSVRICIRRSFLASAGRLGSRRARRSCVVAGYLSSSVRSGHAAGARRAGAGALLGGFVLGPGDGSRVVPAWGSPPAPVRARRARHRRARPPASARATAS